MANLGRLGWIGIATNSTAGDDDAPDKYIPYLSCDLHEVIEPIEDGAARGIREDVSSGSSTSNEGGPIIGKKRGEGTIECLVDVENAPYLIIPALGTVSTTTASGEDAVYEHTITRKADNTPKTVSINQYRVADTNEYLYATVNTQTISFADGAVTISTNFVTKFPTTGDGTKSLTEERIFSFKDCSVKFGDTLTAADSSSAIPVRAFSLTLDNGISGDAIHYLSGSNDVNSISLGDFKLSGSFALFFTTTTYRDIYRDLDKKSIVLSITGDSIGSAETAEIQFRIPRTYFTDYPIETGISGFFVETPTWKAGYDSGQSSSITCVITNETASYT